MGSGNYRPGVAMECCEKDGLHVFEDHFIAEVIDPLQERYCPTVKPGNWS